MTQRIYLGGVCGRDGSYGIVFPDFPGCVSAGETLMDVLAMGKEALQFHIEAMVEDGDPIADPTPVDFSRLQSEFSDPDDPADDETWVAVVGIEVTLPTFPDTISVPVKADIVREIAQLVQDNVGHLSSRHFIEDAARRELERLKKPA
jgi:predicted RNase H-like HicB family nuclease